MTISHSRSSARACFVLLITSLFFFYGFGLSNLFNALEVPLVHTFHFKPSEMGLISSLYFWANFLVLLPIGMLLDRISLKKIIAASMALSFLSVAAIAAAQDVWMLAAARLIMGLASGACFIGCIRLAINWFDLDKMALVAGFVMTMGMLGGFMVQSPLIALINHIGWRDALYVVSAIGAVATLLILLFVTDYPKGCAPSVTEKAESHSILLSLKLTLGSAQNWLAGLSGSLMNLPIFVIGALWGVPFLMTVHHLTNVQAGLVTGMLFFGAMIGSPLVGWLSDSIKRRKLPLLLGVILSLLLVITIIMIQQVNIAVLFALFFALGVTTSVQTLSYPIVAESNPHHLNATASSIVSMQMLLSAAIAQPLFGWIVQRFGGVEGSGHYSASAYVTAMHILPIAFLFSVVAAFLVKETYARR